MTPQAAHAIKAAQNRYNWGRWATRQYCQKHKVPFGAYRLACQLEAISPHNPYPVGRYRVEADKGS